MDAIPPASYLLPSRAVCMLLPLFSFQRYGLMPIYTASWLVITFFDYHRPSPPHVMPPVPAVKIASHIKISRQMICEIANVEVPSSMSKLIRWYADGFAIFRYFLHWEFSFRFLLGRFNIYAFTSGSITAFRITEHALLIGYIEASPSVTIFR